MYHNQHNADFCLFPDVRDEHIGTGNDWVHHDVLWNLSAGHVVNH